MEQATRIILIRHGETDWNTQTRIQGHIDIPLNRRGRWQAERLGAAMAEEGLAAVYASDLQRARDTAQAVAHAAGLEVQLSASLRERAFGMFEGRTWAEIEAQWPEDTRRWRDREPGWAPTHGETLEQVRDRVALATEALAARHRGEQIVLVAHGGVMDALYRLATQQPMQAPRSWSLGNAAINRLLWSPQGLTLVGWGDTRHLEDAALDESST